MQQNVILGAIYWPVMHESDSSRTTVLQGFMRSEKIPFPSSALFSNSSELYCPHLNAKNVCMNKVNGNNKCGYKDESDGMCEYYDYHKFFLLLNINSKEAQNILKPFEESRVEKPTTYSKLYSSSNNAYFPTTLNAFPQPSISKLGGWEVFKSGIAEKVFFDIPEMFLEGNRIKANNVKDISDYPINDYVYASSEYTFLERLKNQNGDRDAFVVLVEKEKVKDLLLSEELQNVEEREDIYIPVKLSFYADGKIDAILSLAIRTRVVNVVDNGGEADEDKLMVEPVNSKLVRQALGSMREVIYNQRQEFLEKWCMRLGECVDDIVQEAISKNPDDHDQGIKKAMKFALRAIFKMAITLTVQKPPSVCNIKTITEKFNYETDKKKKKPEQIFKPINDHLIVHLNVNCVDRKKYVIDFCKKAERYAEEFVASEGKLKGRLSAPAVRELKKMAHTSDPVNARILIRGEPGGGKGATAEDFHFYCMKRIARDIKEKEIEWETKKAEIDKNQDADKKKEEQKKIGEDPYTYLIKHSKCLERAEKNLQAMFSLPAIYSEISEGAEADFFLRQISSTGWWLWKRTPDEKENFDEEMKKNINESLARLNLAQKFIEQSIRVVENKNHDKLDPTTVVNAQNFFKGKHKFKDNVDDESGGLKKIEVGGTKEDLIKYYVELLRNKIQFEDSSNKPDWSFNFLQVNCGILGGENSELAEAIERLFGKSGNHKTTLPGLFQTCSYMGGTLFLDEIADAPVRVQDNLLRPLEEEKVSRPGWETFDENVGNIRIVGATFKNLFKLARQYHETLLSGNPKGFRPDLLTRLTRNPPVSVTPIWHYFVPPKPIDIEDFSNQFAFVLNSSWEVSTPFWNDVYRMVSKQIDEHCEKARYHIPGEHEGRRKFASKITMRLFKEVGNIARLNTKEKDKKPKNDDPQIGKAKEYLSRMLDYLLLETN